MRPWALPALLLALAAGAPAAGDEVDLLQVKPHTLAAEGQGWPDLGDIVDRAKEAGDRARDTIHAVQDQASAQVVGGLDRLASAVISSFDLVRMNVDTYAEDVQERGERVLMEMNRSVDSLYEVRTHGLELMNACLKGWSEIDGALVATIGGIHEGLDMANAPHLSEILNESLGHDLDRLAAFNATLRRGRDTFANMSSKDLRSARGELRTLASDLRAGVEHLEEFETTFIDSFRNFTLSVDDWVHNILGANGTAHVRRIFGSVERNATLTANQIVDASQAVARAVEDVQQALEAQMPPEEEEEEPANAAGGRSGAPRASALGASSAALLGAAALLLAARP